MLTALAVAAALVQAAPAASTSATPRVPAQGGLEVQVLALANGLTVVLHPDRRLPQAVVSTWFGVGSKDEAVGRTGFAHLFEHLMFMGTKRVPGSGFDVIMETGGGFNNASTSEDRTHYYSSGPSSLLPTLLWLDADRFASLDEAMTQQKLDLQRDVVRNERRQTVENRPYGRVELLVPDLMYPEGHPYHHSVIGSHEDLQAASLDDVKGFFQRFYVPGNATLVVAGDFDPAAVRPLVEGMFGAVPARPAPPLTRAEPVKQSGEIRRTIADRVELPRLELVWHAPPAYARGTAELALLAEILWEGPSSRLDRRLVQELRLATEVAAALEPRALGSLFHVQVTGVPGADLDRIKRETLAILADLAARGPTPAELARVKAQAETQFRAGKEQLRVRAEKMNEYLFYLGEPDAFDRDLARFTGASVAGLREAARTLGEGRLDLRVLPAATTPTALPDRQPPDLPGSAFEAPAPEVLRLGNGVEVRAVRLPGSGLFAAHIVTRGGERTVPAEKAGVAPVVARLLLSGAGGRSAPAWADAIRTLGASVETRATRTALDVQVVGLASRLGPTLDLLADALLRPNLSGADVERELDLARARVTARADDPRALAQVATAAALYGDADHRGRPVDGYARTLARVTPADVRNLAPRLLDPRGAVIVVAGDVEPAAVAAALEARLGGWRARGAPPAAPLAPVTSAPGGRWFLVDRPGAPQTVIQLARPVTRAEDVDRAVRLGVNTILGGTFTSRLNQNLRERNGYSYGAGSRFVEEGPQTTLVVQTSVQTEVTGPALLEIRKELDGLSAGLSDAEVGKARESIRFDLVDAVQTTVGLADLLAVAARDGRAADALRRDAAALAALDTERAVAEARTGLFGFAGMTVVLVGDREAILPQLARAGLPVPALLDPEGRPLASGR
jgi:predicted Zn-dependent peptidase